MNKTMHIVLFVLIHCILLEWAGHGSETDRVLRGPYLGQKEPENQSEIFAPGIVSTEGDEINAVFSPDGKEFYYAADTYKNTSKAGKSYMIMVTREDKDGWTYPVPASFSGKYMDADIFITADGKKMFFCSDRPGPGEKIPRDNADIWIMKREGKGWTTPSLLGPEVNSNRNEWYPTQARNGNLYFSSSRPEGFGGTDIYCSTYTNGRFQKPENLGKPVNTEKNEGDIFVAPDESYLIVVSSHRSDGLGSGDLYISFRQPDQSWSEPQNMGPTVNTQALEYCPMLSPDGKFLFFTSRRRGNDDIYWVKATLIAKLKRNQSN